MNNDKSNSFTYRSVAPIDWELLVIFAVCNLFYPVWYLPGTNPLLRLGIFHLLWMGFLALWYSLRILPLDDTVTLFSIPDDWTWDSRRTLLLTSLGGGSVLFHLYQQLRWNPPTPSRGDFHQYLAESGGVAYYIRSHLSVPLTILLLVLGTTLLVGILYYWILHKEKLTKQYSTGTLLAITYVLSLVGTIIFLYSGLIEQLGGEYFIFRRPPLGKYLYLFFFLLAGLREIPIRIFQVFFLVLSVALWLAWTERSVLAPIVILGFGFLPLHSVGFFLDNSLINFMFYFLILFLYLGYLKKPKPSKLAVLYTWVGIGMMFRREVVFIGLIVSLHLFFFLCRNGREIKDWLSLGWGFTVLLLAGPFTLVGMILRIRPASIRPLELVNPEKWIQLFNTFSRGAGLPILIVLLAGFVIHLFWNRSRKSLFLIFYSIVMAIILVSRPPMYSVRHNLVLFVPFLVGTGESLSQILSKRRHRILTGLVLLVFLGSLVFPYATSSQPLILKEWNYYRHDHPAKHSLDTREFFPYPKLMHYLKNRFPGNRVVYAPMRTEPSHFYLYKTGLLRKVRWMRKPYFTAFESKKDLLDHFEENSVSYVVSPTGEYAKNRMHHTPVLSRETLNWLEDSSRFKLIKRFHYENYELSLFEVRNHNSNE